MGFWAMVAYSPSWIRRDCSNLELVRLRHRVPPSPCYEGDKGAGSCADDRRGSFAYMVYGAIQDHAMKPSVLSECDFATDACSQHLCAHDFTAKSKAFVRELVNYWDFRVR